MKVNLQKIVPNFSFYKDTDGSNYFKQLNIYETVQYNTNVHKSVYSYGYSQCICNSKFECCSSNIRCIEHTWPLLSIASANVVDTVEGVSLEGQHLTGKKLVIVGEIDLSLVITYNTIYNSCDTLVKKVKMPFSTFIIIPKYIYDIENIDLKYLIEDVSTVEVCVDKILVSITLLLQYINK